MKLAYILFYFYILIFSFSCSYQRETNNTMSIVATNEMLTFQLDKNTQNWIQSLFLFKDIGGKEYLTFQNEGQNELLIYNLISQKMESKIIPSIDGNEGVGLFLGYYIHNLDSIFLTVTGIPEISIINKEAHVIDKLSYEIATDSTLLKQIYSTSNIYQPLYIIDNKLYFVPGCNRWGKKNPMCAYIDLATRKTHTLPLPYPKFPGADNKAKRAGVEEYLSRCYNGKEFIYSFYFEEDIYIASLDHKQIERKKIKSRYIKNIKTPNDYNQGLDLQTGFRESCERSNYGNLLYDKYRDVYYRIAFPQTEIEDEKINTMELMRYGRKVFSIIILDNQFNIIGETLFPEYTYNSNLIFIREDGIYISNSHFMNPTFNDDVLSFHKFELKQEN